MQKIPNGFLKAVFQIPVQKHVLSNSVFLFGVNETPDAQIISGKKSGVTAPKNIIAFRRKHFDLNNLLTTPDGKFQVLAADILNKLS